jgi:hypothetical protein
LDWQPQRFSYKIAAIDTAVVPATAVLTRHDKESRHSPPDNEIAAATNHHDDGNGQVIVILDAVAAPIEVEAFLYEPDKRKHKHCRWWIIGAWLVAVVGRCARALRVYCPSGMCGSTGRSNGSSNATEQASGGQLLPSS